MICGDQGLPVEFEQFRNDARATCIDRLNRFDAGFDNTGVADHVRVGEVKDNEIVVRHARKEFFGHFEGAHLGFKVVGSDLGRRNQFPVFSGKRFLDSAIKKIGDMRIFLRLGDAQLPFSGCAHDFAQNVFQVFRRENEGR